MRISVQLNSASIDNAIRQIEAYRNSLDSKCSEVARRLCEIGLDVVNAAYVAASYAGTNDIEVHLEPGDGMCSIVANGSTLAFIELGTGISWPAGEYSGQLGAVPHGQYGHGRGKQSKWAYKGDPGNMGEPDSKRPGLVWTSGNPPANAFPKAVEAIKAETEQVIGEVFGRD